MEQRARWFGYKESYLDLCRIWMTGPLRETYVNLLRHEDDFWESLERHKQQNIPITQWPRFFRLDGNNLRLTRAEVARSERFRIRGWKIMQPLIPTSTDDPKVDGNLQAIDGFIADRQSETLRYGNIEHHIYRSLPLDQVIEMLVSRVEGGKNWDTQYVSEYLRRLQFGGILGNIDVVLMRPNADTHRSPDPNGRINPMQGPNATPVDPNYYPGDYNFHENRPQLQIHRYRYLEDGPRTCSLSLYMPKEDRFDLAYIVGGEDI